MEENEIVESIERQQWLDPVAQTMRDAAGALFQGDVGRKIEDLLHGTWLGHPLHPVLTDIPIGAWTVAAVLDTADMAGCDAAGPAADMSILIGLSAALKTAASGLADWQYTSGTTSRVGVAHALCNITATTLYGLSYMARRKKARRAGRVLSMLGLAAVSAGGWLGGMLVFEKHVGVDHATRELPPGEWTAVMGEDRLEEDTPTRVDAGGVPVLLVKRGRWIYALANACAHMGGPLSEGTLKGDCVVCPWHGSTFRLSDGENVTGPSAFPQPTLEVRVRHGRIEVRSMPA